QQLHAVELRRVGDSVDAVEDGIDLELIGFNFLTREGAAVGGLVGQAFNLQQQGGDFAQRAFRRVDHVVGAAGVVDRLVDAGDLGGKVFAGDEARRRVLARVDLQTRGEALEAGRQVCVVLVEPVDRLERCNVRVNPTHVYPP